MIKKTNFQMNEWRNKSGSIEFRRITFKTMVLAENGF